jgi:BTB/POZ domain
MKRVSFYLSLQELFETLGESHPVIVLKDVKAKHLEMLLEFVYCGRVDFPQSEMKAFKSVAESLKIPVNCEGQESEIETDFDSLPEIMSQEQIQPESLLDQTMKCPEQQLTASNFEDMIDEAQAQFVIIPDDDEAAMPDAIQKEAPVIEKEPEGASRFFFKTKCDTCWNKVEPGGKARYQQSHASLRTYKTMLRCNLCRTIFTRPMYLGPYHPKLRPAKPTINQL